MRGKRKTARFQLVLSPSDKELITQAASVAFSKESSTAGTISDVVRDGATRLAADFLGVKSGKFTLIQAMENYRSLIMAYLPDEDIFKSKDKTE